MTSTVVTRFLTSDDIPVLLQLESQQWTPIQAATAQTLRSRLKAQPDLCVGGFCSRTGEALASLFLRPITPDDIARAHCWEDCALVTQDGTPTTTEPTRSLFGISLTSIDPQAVTALFAFFWPYALKNGWCDIYLGSPVPGLKRALKNDPTLEVKAYAYARRGKLPRDPQLRYYYKKGFTRVVAVLPDYFPHEASLNHGVLVRGRVPLSRLSLVWRRLPFKTLRTVLDGILCIERLYGEYAIPRVRPKAARTAR